MADERSEAWLQADRRTTKSGSKGLSTQWLAASKTDRGNRRKLSAEDHEVFLDGSERRRRAAS